MKSLLAVVVRSAIEYTYGLMDRFYKDEGRMPSKDELLKRIDNNIIAILSEK